MAGDTAIVGLSFKFPGAADEAALDRILSDGHLGGRSVIRLPPPERWPFHRPADSAALLARHELAPCGLIDDAFDFDPAPFFISPREARLLDPQHRMALELALQAQEDAGYGGGALAGTRAGVFIGTTRTDYLDAIAPYLGPDDYMAALSNSRAVLANRISSVFDLHGPSLTIDTLCSSSAVAVHQACRALRARDCDFALAGGVNFLMSPHYLMALRRLGLMSPSGACRPFSGDADGFVPSEGGAILCLKRLEDALGDRDSIHAVIVGSGIVHHGRSVGLTVPDPQAMEQIIRLALDEAGLCAKDIGLVQAMGASSTLGDRAELQALRAIFAEGERGDGTVAVSCEKGAIGHLEPASGLAGLLAALRALGQGRRFPLHGVANGSAESAGLRFVARPEEWISSAPRRVGINSFGMTGTHVHIILEQPPSVESEAAVGWMVLPVGADTDAGLALQASAYADAMAGWADGEARDACFTAAVGRRHGRHRAAVLAKGRHDLGQALEALACGGEAADGATIVRGPRDAAYAPHVAPIAAVGRSGHAADRARCEEAARTFVAGGQVDWHAVQIGRRHRVRLPTTHLNRQRFLFEPPEIAERAAPGPVAELIHTPVHPLLRAARKG